MIKHRVILLLSTAELGDLLPHLNDDWAVSIESVIEAPPEPEKPKRPPAHRPAPAREAILGAIDESGGGPMAYLVAALERAGMKATSFGPTTRRLVEDGLIVCHQGVWRRTAEAIDAEPAL